MTQFNITAQVYETKDKHKQTLFVNHVIESLSLEEAEKQFNSLFDMINPEYKLLKIYSVEPI